MQSVWQHKDLHILVILIEALLDEKFNAVWMVSVKAADRIRADVKDDVFFSPVTKWFHHLLLEMLPFAMPKAAPPPSTTPPSFQWIQMDLYLAMYWWKSLLSFAGPPSFLQNDRLVYLLYFSLGFITCGGGGWWWRGWRPRWHWRQLTNLHHFYC